eukprot:CAMPEP_0202894208 /NCGR_PEP_ID=MMETSP1392-20130828/3656_1 /ASSEMBLY_ACC=CAM_ASM_000868 /TAXON_ID=225041 /ORGANISM="Chlamydomonas chlamydogama, Strain SAG 11-48b" /LENGTH=188 /DNA_ID=CAMNT_0049578827 /DNA_START=400 /DNA_END=962 /DNA_ORIENTATION=-
MVNRQGLVFAAQRVDDSKNTWQMPQGGIDEGEDPAAAALRELQEETSVSSARIVGEIDEWLSYDFPTKVREKLYGPWTRYKGQKQKWYLIQFYGSDGEINLETEHKEFKAWAWKPLEELPQSVVEFKADVYSRVAERFGPLIQQLQHNGELMRRQAPGARLLKGQAHGARPLERQAHGARLLKGQAHG